jgi:hypothetical protein
LSRRLRDLSLNDYPFRRLHFSLCGVAMKDSEISNKKGKVFPKPQPLVIEKVSTILVKQCESRSGQIHGHGMRQVIMSLPRVRWLERPDVSF